MPRFRSLIVGTVVAFLLPACGGPRSLGPTPVDEGIVVYADARFAGPSQAMAVDVSDLGDVRGACPEGDDTSRLAWNDCISSIRVLPGWGATVFGDRNFRGAKLDVTEDIPDLKAISGTCSGSYNDCISSIRVYRR